MAVLGSHGVRWQDRWNAYWFPETTTLRLAICRIVIVAAQLALFFPALESHLSLLSPFRGFIEPQALIAGLTAIFPGFPSASGFVFIYWGTVATGVAALVGLLTRPSCFFFALGNWILAAHAYSYGEDHHPDAILCIFLLLLAFSPSGGRLSVDALVRRFRRGSPGDRAGHASERTTMALWPLILTQVLLSFAYLSTGAAKVVFGGLRWMNGYTLQQIVFTSAIQRDLPLGVWLAQQHTLSMLLSIGVVALELFFFLSLLIPRSVPFFLVAGTLMHLGIYLFEGSAFFTYIVLYVVFIDFDRLLPWLRQRVRRGANTPVSRIVRASGT